MDTMTIGLFAGVGLAVYLVKNFLEGRRAEWERIEAAGPRHPLPPKSSGNALADTLYAYQCGDYQGACEAAQAIPAVGDPPSPESEFFRGAMMLAGGRPEESEAALRQYVSDATHPAGLAAADALLGELLMERGQYHEAAECLHASLRLAPDQSAPLRHLAVLTLRQGNEAATAVEFARQAVNLERDAPRLREEQAKAAAARARELEIDEAASRILGFSPAEAERAAATTKKFPWRSDSSRESPETPTGVESVEGEKPPSAGFRTSGMAENLAALAWAVAARGRDEAEVEGLVAEAQQLARGKGVPTRAEVHFYAACAYTELGDPVKSAKHFTLAASEDINGRWCRAAKEMLLRMGKQSAQSRLP
jgi:tetratricopeptide (TPR) repeat protein